MKWVCTKAELSMIEINTVWTEWINPNDPFLPEKVTNRMRYTNILSLLLDTALATLPNELRMKVFWGNSVSLEYPEQNEGFLRRLFPRNPRMEWRILRRLCFLGIPQTEWRIPGETLFPRNPRIEWRIPEETLSPRNPQIEQSQVFWD